MTRALFEEGFNCAFCGQKWDKPVLVAKSGWVGNLDDDEECGSGMMLYSQTAICIQCIEMLYLACFPPAGGCEAGAGEGRKGTMELQPITFEEACEFVRRLHRHHKPPEHDCSPVAKDRDEARHVARCLWDVLKSIDVLADLRAENAGAPYGTPEFDLYVHAAVADELSRETAWLHDLPPAGGGEAGAGGG